MSREISRAEFMATLSPEAVSTVKMLAAIGPSMSVNDARENILKIGKHPDDTVGNSPLWIQTEEQVFDPPEEKK